MLHTTCCMEILGVRVDNFSRGEILAKIESFLEEEKFHQICTVNPEFILTAQKNAQFKSVLSSSALNVADGVGVWYAFLRNFTWLKTRVAGADLMQEILHLAEKQNLPVFLALRKDGLSSLEEIKGALAEKYPQLNVIGEEYDLSHQSSIIDYQNAFGAGDRLLITGDCVLFCNFGAPEQELFINSVKNAKIRLAMGVGGSFDFLTGKLKRAPKTLRILGLEWLYRFAQEPKYRCKRIWNAVVVFPLKVVLGVRRD